MLRKARENMPPEQTTEEDKYSIGAGTIKKLREAAELTVSLEENE